MTDKYFEIFIQNLKNENENLNLLCENKDRIDFFIDELIKYFNCNRYNNIDGMKRYKIATLFNDVFLTGYTISSRMQEFGRSYKWIKKEPEHNVITSNDVRLFIQHILYGELMKRHSMLLYKIQNTEFFQNIADIRNQIDVLDDFIPLFSDGTIYLNMWSTLLSVYN